MSDRGLPTGDITMPGLETVRAVVAAMDDAGIETAVGGSGLLAALGLADRVRDWDVTTDAEPSAVCAALTSHGIPYTVQPAAEGRYATKGRLRVDGGDHDIDIIVGFAVRTVDRIVELPTRITGHWLGLPLADPAVWAHAYRAIGRPDRAATLDAWLRGASADAHGDRSAQ